MLKGGECMSVVINNSNINCKALLFVEQTANMHTAKYCINKIKFSIKM